MGAVLVLPIIVPFGTAILALFLRRSIPAQRIVSLAGASALAVSAVALFTEVRDKGYVVLHVGSWPAPFGITLVADLFSAIMVLLAALMLLCVSIYALSNMDESRERHGFHPLLHLLIMGVCGAFLTGDLFNLYVWFEVMLMASFVLLALGGERPQLEGAIKYVALNLLSSAVFLAAAGILYGAVGTLNMADAAVRVQSLRDSGLPAVLGAMFLVAFGIKAAAFPLFFWLPASYHTPPVAVSAIFAGLLTKVGVYSLIRVFTLIFTAEDWLHTLILWMSGFTMVTGVLGAMSQNDIRRILSFHSVSQIGYMLMGLGLFTPLGLAGSMLYVIHHTVVKSNLFLLGGLISRAGGSFWLQKVGGLYARAPLLAFLFLVTALSLSGIPPLSGFWAKFVLVRSGFEAGQWAVTATSLGVSLLTLFSMTKIWTEAFWAPAPEGQEVPAPHERPWRAGLIPVTVLVVATAAIGLAVEPVMEILQEAARQLSSPETYIRAVLGEVTTR